MAQSSTLKYKIKIGLYTLALAVYTCTCILNLSYYIPQGLEYDNCHQCQKQTLHCANCNSLLLQFQLPGMGRKSKFKYDKVMKHIIVQLIEDSKLICACDSILIPMERCDQLQHKKLELQKFSQHNMLIQCLMTFNRQIHARQKSGNYFCHTQYQNKHSMCLIT